MTEVTPSNEDSTTLGGFLIAVMEVLRDYPEACHRILDKLEKK